MPLSVVLDTSVLYPMVLRDVMLGCAERQLINPLWTVDILDELRRNLIRDAKLKPQSVERLIDYMHGSFPDALITDYQALIPSMPNHYKDRHVLAAAVHVGAKTIVTSNLRHFPPHALAVYSIIAQSPDDCLGSIIDAHSTTIMEVIQQLANDYNKPPLSVGEILKNLGKTAPTFATEISGHLLADQL